jgi:HORMA domain
MDSQLFLTPQDMAVESRAARRPSRMIPNEQEAVAIQMAPISQEQSSSLVEIFLNAAIASVLYTRELFKHDCEAFEERCVADLLNVSGPMTYDDFRRLQTPSGHANSQVFKILLRSGDKRADKILDLLVCIRSRSPA